MSSNRIRIAVQRIANLEELSRKYGVAVEILNVYEVSRENKCVECLVKHGLPKPIAWLELKIANNPYFVWLLPDGRVARPLCSLSFFSKNPCNYNVKVYNSLEDLVREVAHGRGKTREKRYEKLPEHE